MDIFFVAIPLFNIYCTKMPRQNSRQTGGM